MHKIISILLLLNFFFSFQSIGQSEKIKRNWIKKDKANFHNLIDFLSKDELDLDEFKSKIQNLDIREEDSLWFNCKRIEATQYGGYISNWINLETINNKIFSLQIEVTREDAKILKMIAEEDEIVKKALTSNWTFSEKRKLKYEFNYENEELKKEFELLVEKKLGKIQEIEVKGELKEAYEILLNPIFNYDYGHHCYFGGTQPEGRIAIEKLVEAKRFDLIKNIIRGYNPEGRAYGIEVLLKAHSRRNRIINAEDENVIKWLLKTEFNVNSCSGCFVMSNSYSKIFEKIKIK